MDTPKTPTVDDMEILVWENQTTAPIRAPARETFRREVIIFLPSSPCSFFLIML